MTGTDFIVVAVGASAGYWLVSFFLRGAGSGKAPGGEPRRGNAQETRQDRFEQGPSARDDFQTPPRAQEASSGPRWHEVLEVPAAADADEIRAAYRRLISQYHPDKVASLGAELRELAHRKSQEITAAYQEGMRAQGEQR